MKKNLILIGAVTAIFALTLTACKKDEEKKTGCTDPTATNYDASAEEDDGSCIQPAASQPSTYTPTYSGINGVLVGIKTITTVTQPIVGTVDFPIGTAAAFFSENGGSSFVGAGTVTADGNTLTAQSNNSYIYTPSGSDTDGIAFGSSLSWNGTGGTWPAFDIVNYDGFSDVYDISSGDVTVSSAYTVSTGGIYGADSIYFALHSPTGSKSIIIAGNTGTSSYTFSASDVSGLGKGSGYVQVVGINYNNQTLNSKNYWLLNETVRTKMVNFK